MQQKLMPDRILNLGFGFFAAKVLMTAVDMGVFTLLAIRSMTGSELGAALGLSPRGIADFFDALVSMGLLEREGDGAEGCYSNSDESAMFLDQKSDRYVGGILAMANQRLYGFWGSLGEALQTGQAQSEAKKTNRSLFDEMFSDPCKLREFCDAMAGLSYENFAAFVEKFSFKNFKRHVDVGGSTGLLSRMVVEKYPHMQSVCFDLPAVIEVAREKLKLWGLGDRIELTPGSFLTDPLPSGDVITMGNILHDWNSTQKILILRSAYDALPIGGALVIIENLIDDKRRENTFGLLMSLNMLVEFGDAFDSTFSEVENWASKVGFTGFQRLHIYGPCSAVVAYK